MGPGLESLLDNIWAYGMMLSAEKSFWMTLGCSADESDRDSNSAVVSFMWSSTMNYSSTCSKPTTV